MTEDGFYKNVSGQLFYAPNFVYHSDYTLIRQDKDQLLWADVFPIDGWYWFDTKAEAVASLKVDFPTIEDPEQNQVPPDPDTRPR